MRGVGGEGFLFFVYRGDSGNRGDDLDVGEGCQGEGIYDNVVVYSKVYFFIEAVISVGKFYDRRNVIEEMFNEVGFIEGEGEGVECVEG